MTPLVLLLGLCSQAASTGEDTYVERGRLVEGRRCAADPTQTYSLYLPKEYPGGRAWPVLLIMDPRGRSVRAAERFVPAAEEFGFILVSSNDTRSDSDPEPNMRALRALWPEIDARFTIDPRRVYLAGFSGTGTLAFDIARRSGEIAGVIAAGAHWEHSDRLDFPCFGAAGDADFNYRPMASLHERLREWGTPERLEVFDGPHSWMPPELAHEAVAWMEVQAMRSGRRPRDAALIRRLLDRDLSLAAGLEAAERPLAARRRFEAAVATFDGLAPVEEARVAAERLGKDPATRRALDAEKRWDHYEESMLRRHDDACRELVSADLPLAALLFVPKFGVDELRTHAGAAGYEGAVGRRLLNTLATRTGFYLPRDLRRQGDHARAAVALAVATAARPEQPGLWYDLACARARAGFRREALDALEEAVARGFDRWSHLHVDKDLDPVRDDPRFRALVGASRPREPGPP